MTALFPKLVAIPLVGLAFLPLAASANEPASEGRNVLIGMGVQTIPRYPGANTNRTTVLPEVDTWRSGEPMGVESPDEAISFALAGRRGSGLSAGPAFTFAPTRDADDIPGLPKVGFGVEAGAFIEAWPVTPIRLRGEMRQAIGAHKGLTGDISADLVIRQGNEGPIMTVGPRLRWGSAKHQRAYFGVPVTGAGSLPGYEPGSGIYAVGVTAGARIPLNRSFGLYGYIGYDRLTGGAADSPIVTNGSTDQYSAGLALTYRFRI